MRSELQQIFIMAEVGKKAIEDVIGREIGWDEDIEQLLREKGKELEAEDES